MRMVASILDVARCSLPVLARICHDMKKMGLFALVLLSTVGLRADPIDYWFTANVNGARNNAISASGAYRLATDGSTGVDWVDGNWFCVYTAYTPDWLTPAVTGMDPGTLNADITIKPYGIKYASGARNWTGNGRMEVGAGGFTAPRAWDAVMSMFFSGGLHITASQMWDSNTGVNFNLPVTTEDDVTWTFKYDTTAALGQYRFSKANDLSGCDTVFTNGAKLQLSASAASVKAKSITLADAKTYIIFDSATHALTLGADYTDHLILANGASLKASQTFEGVTLDLGSITVTGNGTTSTLGDCEAYYVANGGTQPLEVKSGATVRLASLPASGRFSVSGAGTVEIAEGSPQEVDFNGFSGTVKVTGDDKHLSAMPAGITGAVVFSGRRIKIDDLSGYTGNITVSGNGTLFLPAMNTWNANMTVTTTDGAILYLPSGSVVDASRILGTGNYRASVRGLVTEPAGTITVGVGETLVVGGDGFTAATDLVLDGGMIYFARPCTISSSLTVDSSSRIGSALNVTGEVAGAVLLKRRLSVTNEVTDAVLVDGKDVWPSGCVKFTGGGTVKAADVQEDVGDLYLHFGNLVLSGAGKKWKFEGNATMTIIERARHALLTDGVEVLFSSGTDGTGVSVATRGTDPSTLEVASGASLTLERYRAFSIGGGYWRSHSTLLVNGGTVTLKEPDGRFIFSTWAANQLKNDAADRCPMVDIKVVNGGVLETDRAYVMAPVTHTLDSSAHYGVPYESGTFVTLDGGTYKLGSGFGYDPDYAHSGSTGNRLFVGRRATNVSRTDTFDGGYTVDLKVTIGPNGGTFDFSEAKTVCSVYSNMVADSLYPASLTTYPAGFSGDTVPSRGPRWELNGPLTIKGNGAQSFVMNAFTNGQLTEVVADGIVGVVVNTNATGATLATLTLGAPGGGLRATDAVGAPKALAINAISVRADGTYDSAPFDAANTTVGAITFAEGATLATSGATLLPVSGVVTLASVMHYFAPSGIGPVTGAPVTVLTAGGGVQTTGTTWLRGGGSTRKYVEVETDRISFVPAGFTVNFR